MDWCTYDRGSRDPCPPPSCDHSENVVVCKPGRSHCQTLNPPVQDPHFSLWDSQQSAHMVYNPLCLWYFVTAAQTDQDKPSEQGIRDQVNLKQQAFKPSWGQTQDRGVTGWLFLRPPSITCRSVFSCVLMWSSSVCLCPDLFL